MDGSFWPVLAFTTRVGLASRGNPAAPIMNDRMDKCFAHVHALLRESKARRTNVGLGNKRRSPCAIFFAF